MMMFYFRALLARLVVVFDFVSSPHSFDVFSGFISHVDDVPIDSSYTDMSIF